MQQLTNPIMKTITLTNQSNASIDQQSNDSLAQLINNLHHRHDLPSQHLQARLSLTNKQTNNSIQMFAKTINIASISTQAAT
jgi:hypothetical protein